MIFDGSRHGISRWKPVEIESSRKRDEEWKEDTFFPPPSPIFSTPNF
jgi:hypothetical protein